MCHFLCWNKNLRRLHPWMSCLERSLKIEERIRRETTTVWTSEHLMMSPKKGKWQVWKVPHVHKIMIKTRCSSVSVLWRIMSLILASVTCLLLGVTYRIKIYKMRVGNEDREANLKWRLFAVLRPPTHTFGF